jgi:hypothetical protein
MDAFIGPFPRLEALADSQQLIADGSHAAAEACARRALREVDAETVKVTSVIPSKQDGKSIMDDRGDEFRELDHICVRFATFNRAWASRPKEDVQRAGGTNGEQGQSGKSLRPWSSVKLR